jgi:hypothetical protein
MARILGFHTQGHATGIQRSRASTVALRRLSQSHRVRASREEEREIGKIGG